MDSAADRLRSRLDRYPADRYPVQHATAQFHLGSVLLEANQMPAALEALEAAERIFAELGMQLEHAKAMMMHGVARRGIGEADVAERQFASAAEIFVAAGQPLELAAAHFNLCLVRAGAGDLAGASGSFAKVCDGFRAAGLAVWAAVAAREHGTAWFNGGKPEVAIPLLEDAVALAGDADPAGAGAAANVLGLAQLAVNLPAAAVRSFRVALGWHPRSVRPAEHAMVKANLALAYQAAGAAAAARLTAGHALTLHQAPEEVRNVAAGVQRRLPPEAGSDLFAVLHQEPVERWEIWVRDEVLRWSESDLATRNEEAVRWLREQVRCGAKGVEYAQVLLGVILELPPAAFDRIVAALVEAAAAVDPVEADRFQSVTRSAMARYPVPQWQRLAASFTAAAEQAGHPQRWK
jgi:tetratricopeptide (TPR) repeat protein